MSDIFTKLLFPQALTDHQIEALVEGRANLVTHDKIANYPDIFALMGPHQAAVILYVLQRPAQDTIFGHWCCVFTGPTPNTITYFDPYGGQPDTPLSHMDPSVIEEFGNYPHLFEMLQEAQAQGHPVIVNTYQLQAKKPNDAICGRLTGLRVQLRNLTGDQFAQMLKPRFMTSDEIATAMTSFIN